MAWNLASLSSWGSASYLLGFSLQLWGSQLVLMGSSSPFPTDCALHFSIIGWRWPGKGCLARPHNRLISSPVIYLSSCLSISHLSICVSVYLSWIIYLSSISLLLVLLLCLIADWHISIAPENKTSPWLFNC